MRRTLLTTSLACWLLVASARSVLEAGVQPGTKDAGASASNPGINTGGSQVTPSKSDKAQATKVDLNAHELSRVNEILHEHLQMQGSKQNESEGSEKPWTKIMKSLKRIQELEKILDFKILLPTGDTEAREGEMGGLPTLFTDSKTADNPQQLKTTPPPERTTSKVTTATTSTKLPVLEGEQGNKGSDSVCPTMKDFLADSKGIWKELSQSKGVKQGIDIVMETTIKAFKAMGACIQKGYKNIRKFYNRSIMSPKGESQIEKPPKKEGLMTMNRTG